MYKIIIYEGNECQGKSTLKKEFEKATNFRHLCVDRMFITSIVYNIFKGRHFDLIDKIIDDLSIFICEFDPLFVIVKSDLEIQLKRFDDRGDWYIKKEELNTLNKLFEVTTSLLKAMYSNNFIVVENNIKEDIELNIKKIEEKIIDMET